MCGEESISSNILNCQGEFKIRVVDNGTEIHSISVLGNPKCRLERLVKVLVKIKDIPEISELFKKYDIVIK